MLELFQGASLVLATIAVGLMAGLFWLYAHTIMPGLGNTDDRTFVGAFQAIDRAIINPWFLPVFAGALIATGLAAVLHLGEEARSALPWILVAFALYLTTIVITVRIHLPRNDGIKAAGNPDRIPDLGVVRAQFDEATWVRWNLVRAVATTAALGCLGWALVEYGQTLV
jgi:uncharacterized membrane protein